MTYRGMTPQVLAVATVFLGALFGLNPLWASAYNDAASPAHAGHDGMDMSMPMHHEAANGAMQEAQVLQDKKESEFNHHLAGLLVVLAGLFLVGDGTLRQRWPWARFAWPVSFLACGVFLLVFSDTELWPFGPQSWWYGLTHSLEDLQHKTFAVILLVLGALEIQRARGILKSAWAAWAFPVLAVFGSVMLLFHEHHTGMRGVDHMAVMKRIQAEHFHFAITGGLAGLVKGLSELRTRWQSIFIKCWPLLLFVLGVLLMRYTE